MHDHDSSRAAHPPVGPLAGKWLAALLLVLAGCGSDASSSSARQWIAVVDTVADTIKVHTVSGQVWPSDGELVSDVSIGVLDGAPEYQFGRVLALAVDDPGKM